MEVRDRTEREREREQASSVPSLGYRLYKAV